MDNDNNFPFSDEDTSNDDEIGSDELLSDENLRLPEGANILVRLHAVRAWLSRRCDEATIEVGEAAIVLQEMMQEQAVEARPRRRTHQIEAVQEQFQRAQKALTQSQQRLSAYEEAQSILEDCVAHTSGERVLVEYYLTLEELVLQIQEQVDETEDRSPWLEAMSDVLHRIEHVGTPDEE
ncbi:MAG: hypothetical protein ACXWPS_16635 [Ktedonobacteraceae bacterium]